MVLGGGCGLLTVVTLTLRQLLTFLEGVIRKICRQAPLERDALPRCGSALLEGVPSFGVECQTKSSAPCCESGCSRPNSPYKSGAPCLPECRRHAEPARPLPRLGEGRSALVERPWHILSLSSFERPRLKRVVTSATISAPSSHLKSRFMMQLQKSCTAGCGSPTVMRMPCLRKLQILLPSTTPTSRMLPLLLLAAGERTREVG